MIKIDYKFFLYYTQKGRGCRINALKKKNRVARKGCPVSAFYSII